MAKLETWKGKRVEEMSRAELIEALQWFAERYSQLNDPLLVRQRAEAKVEALKIPIAADPALKPGEWYFDYPGRV